MEESSGANYIIRDSRSTFPNRRRWRLSGWLTLDYPPSIGLPSERVKVVARHAADHRRDYWARQAGLLWRI